MSVTHENGFDSHLLVHFLLQSAAGKVFSCGHRFTLSGTPSITMANSPFVANQLASGFEAEFCAVLTTACKFVGTHVIYYGGSTNFEAYSDNTPAAGTVATNQSLPEEDCVVIRKRTGLADRTHRGRIFVPLVPETLQEESRLTDAGITAYNALAYKFKQVWSFDESLAGMVGTPKHAAWKAGTLDTIVETGVVVDVLNRRDRRDPRALIYQPASA